MRITDEQRQNVVEIEHLDEAYSQWEVTISITLQINHPSGSIHHNDELVYFDRRQVADFIKGLEELDEHRKGEVSITSMSPEVLYLAIKAIDDLGHLAIVVRTAQCSSYYQVFKYKLEAEFEIDPTVLPLIITAFRRM